MPGAISTLVALQPRNLVLSTILGWLWAQQLRQRNPHQHRRNGSNLQCFRQGCHKKFNTSSIK